MIVSPSSSSSSGSAGDHEAAAAASAAFSWPSSASTSGTRMSSGGAKIGFSSDRALGADPDDPPSEYPPMAISTGSSIDGSGSAMLLPYFSLNRVRHSLLW